MEKRVENKVASYINGYKEAIKNKMSELGLSHDSHIELLQYIYDYGNLCWDKEDFTRRKRIKNTIPICDRCVAKRANGEQCTRRRKDDSQYCGTHSKGIPHGDFVVDNINETQTKKIVELTVRDINGIMYYIDSDNNIYNQSHVLSNMVNPECIGKLVEIKNNDNEIEYSIRFN